ncbi:UNVERIFIED_CONTAM: Proteinase inhibitor [Sesamum latifolium]|uniref:Proteinase inhibitor n=1 Tax=Sesamum latifolium TaxID=2727402 RepID=A0AAW2SSX9_9LAMI
MAFICQGKSAWPELVGVSGEIAKKTIEENSLVTAIIVPPSQSFLPADFRCDRVFVLIDDEGNVKWTPSIG